VASPGRGCEQHERENWVRIFRPIAGAAIAAGVLAGGLALGLGLTSAGAATAGTRATTGARTSAARSSGSVVAAHPRAGTASASPSPTARPKHKCTNMPGGGARPGGGSGPVRPSGSAPASS